MSIALARTQAIGAVVHVVGTITAAPGVILGDSTIVIQDASGGIYVRVPDPALPGLVLGSVVDVTGGIAAPYGNLELRPAATGISVIGSASIPAPRAVSMADLGESTEGLLVRANVIVASIDASTTGSLTLIVTDTSGEGRVYFHEPLGVSRTDYAAGEQLQVTGLVGDRLSLFRIWPRTLADVVVTAPAPTPTPKPSPTPSPTPRPTVTPTPHPTATPHPTSTPHPSTTPHPSPTPGQPITIAEALHRQGQSVTVEGIVTTKPGLLDTSAERVTIQDSSGAVLVRLPANTSVSVGQKVRVSGVMGTYYGAPQLTGAALSASGQATATVTRVSTAPIPASLEWRLVSVQGVIKDVHKDGDSWRAEIEVGASTIPLVGIDRSGIPSTALVEGRSATVVGIVKRAYPTSTDQRLALVPRSSADISLGGPGSTPRPGPSGSFHPLPSGAHQTTKPGTGDGSGSGGQSFDGPDGSGSPAASGEPSTSGSIYAAISSLAGHVGEVVRIGGRITAIASGVITIDDGTGQAAVRLTGQAAALADGLHPTEIVNVVGTVTQTAAGGIEVVVDDPAAVARIPAPASLAAVLGADPKSTDSGMGFVDDRATGDTGSGLPIPFIAVTLLLALAGSVLVGLALAGRERRARLVMGLNQALAAARARLARVRVASGRG